MLYLGIDQHAKQLTVSLRDGDGNAVLNRQVSTEPKRCLQSFMQLQAKAGDEGDRRQRSGLPGARTSRYTGVGPCPIVNRDAIPAFGAAGLFGIACSSGEKMFVVGKDVALYPPPSPKGNLDLFALAIARSDPPK